MIQEGNLLYHSYEVNNDIHHHRERVGREIVYNGFLIIDVSNLDISKLIAILKVNT